MSRTALIVAVPAAEPLVGEWRARYDSSASVGVPAHVTILFPFVPATQVDGTVLADLRELFASLPSFRFMLDRVERFGEDVVWLHPEPSEPFAQITAAVVSKWPEHPPYEGVFDAVVPHLTVAEGDAELYELIEQDLAPTLPVDATAGEIVLIAEDRDGRWRERARFPLGT